MIAAAKAAVDPTRNPALLTGRSRAVQAMVDLLLIIKNPGDSGGATRSVYGGHAYAVIGVSIVDAAGATLPFGSTSGMFWPGLYPRVDLLRSQVTVRNPHHTNEPNPTGGATPDGADEGVFSVDLDRFFRLYTDIVSASVPASS
jgi:hypothetical protein